MSPIYRVLRPITIRSIQRGIMYTYTYYFIIQKRMKKPTLRGKDYVTGCTYCAWKCLFGNSSSHVDSAGTVQCAVIFSLFISLSFSYSFSQSVLTSWVKIHKHAIAPTTTTSFRQKLFCMTHEVQFNMTTTRFSEYSWREKPSSSRRNNTHETLRRALEFLKCRAN